MDKMRKFTLSTELKSEAKALSLPEPNIVQSPKKLMKTLLEPDWRKHPMDADLPSNSQLFGHLVYLAGIEGILYPSKLTGKICLAIFPRNFASTSSYLEIDEVPDPRVLKRLDLNTWRQSEMTFKELCRTAP